MSLPTNLSDLFAYLALPTVAAWFISSLIERIPGWTSIPPEVSKISPFAKKLITALVYVGLGLVSYALVHYVPANVVEALQPLYAVIAAALAAWGSASVFHNFFVPLGKTVQHKLALRG